MKQWLTTKHPVPRWLMLAIAVFTIVSFLALYAGALNLDRERQALGVELWHERHTGSYQPLEVPLGGTLRYTAVLIGFLSSLLVIAATLWVVFKRPQCLTVNHSSEMTESMSGQHREKNNV